MNWILLIVALTGVVLVLAEATIRVLGASGRFRNLENEGILASFEQIKTIVETVHDDITSADAMDVERGERLKVAFQAVEARTGDAGIAAGEKGASAGWMFIDSVVRRNVFLGAGVALLLIPALIVSGISIDFGGPTDSSSETPSPTPTR